MVVQAEDDGGVAATSTRRHSTSILVFCLTSSISGGWLACFSFLLFFILKPHDFLILFLCLCNLPFLVTLPVSFTISSLADIRAVVVAPRLTCIAFGLLWAEEVFLAASPLPNSSSTSKCNAPNRSRSHLASLRLYAAIFLGVKELPMASMARRGGQTCVVLSTKTSASSETSGRHRLDFQFGDNEA